MECGVWSLGMYSGEVCTVWKVYSGRYIKSGL